MDKERAYVRPMHYLLSQEQLDDLRRRRLLCDDGYSSESSAWEATVEESEAEMQDIEDYAKFSTCSRMQRDASLQAHVERNLGLLNTALPNWHVSSIIHDASKPQVHSELVKRPTASKLRSVYMNPAFYRPDCLRDILNIQEFATLVLGGTTNLQSYIHSTCLVKQDIAVRAHRRAFIDSAALPEREAQEAFGGLIHSIYDAMVLMNVIDEMSLGRVSSWRPYAVGGLLALPSYVVHGRTDLSVHDATGRVLLSTEVRECSALPNGSLWYRDSGGVQVFGNLLSLPEKTPTLLVTPGKFKVFVCLTDDAKKSSVWTYPSGLDMANLAGASSFQSDGKCILVDAIVISCLLSRTPCSPSGNPSTDTVQSIARLSPSKMTPVKVGSVRVSDPSRFADPTVTATDACSTSESSPDSLTDRGRLTRDSQVGNSIGATDMPMRRWDFPWADVLVFDPSIADSDTE
jgi:hypothetical protein